MGRAPGRIKKTPKDLAEPITPENFEATMEELYPSNLHKEMYWTQEEPEDSLYKWFYEFIRASRDLPRVREEVAAEPGAAPMIDQVDQAFGNLRENFLAWWDAGGARKFAEQGVPRVQVLNNIFGGGGPDLHGGLQVVIPLHLSRDILLEQLNFLLAAYHPGDGLRRHEHSTAQIKIYPRQRYVDTDYELLLRVWKGARELRDNELNVTWWRVYCNAADMQDTLQQLELGNAEDNQLKERFNRAAKKLYSQANRLMTNAIIGHFPRDREND